jgi:chromosomal replication initiator protein
LELSLEAKSIPDSEAFMSTTMHREADPLTEQWNRIRGKLKSEVGDVEYTTWLKQVALAGVDGDEVTVMLPSRFLRDWVRKEYGALLTTFWQAENPSIRAVEIRTGPSRGTAPNLAEPPALTAAAALSAPGARGGEISAPLDPRYTFETFVVGKPNEFAYACARRGRRVPTGRRRR